MTVILEFTEFESFKRKVKKKGRRSNTKKIREENYFTLGESCRVRKTEDRRRFERNNGNFRKQKLGVNETPESRNQYGSQNIKTLNRVRTLWRGKIKGID